MVISHASQSACGPAANLLRSSSLRLRTRKAPARLGHAFGARFVVGHRAKKTFGLAAVGTDGTPLIPGESVRPVFTNGLRHNVFPAGAGRHIPIGMPSERPWSQLVGLAAVAVLLKPAAGTGLIHLGSWRR